MITIYLLRLSFALAASKIKEKARVVAMDLRGHGKSSTENELDLSIEVCIVLDPLVPNGKSRVMLLMDILWFSVMYENFFYTRTFALI